MKTTIKDILLSVLYLFLFLFPWNFLLSGLFVFAFLIYIGYLLIYLMYKFIKNKKIEKNQKKPLEINANIVFNYITIAIFLNTLFILILNILPKDISYNLQYNYIKMYNGAKIWVYILLSCILVPLFENLLIRRNIMRFQNKNTKIILTILSSLLVMIIQPTLIYGVYVFINFLILNLYFIEKENIYLSIIFNVIINLVYSLMILYLSEYKLILCLIMFTVLIINLFLNKEKETA